ncbi:class I SAM-dependent methyltransferase [Zavarzinia compransoris]|uniref:Methyltransferase n=1 Tax=Zavarzinia compransoris TaxID=1264899 RepID=A0A317E5J2_9PROT|nr:class I SAM-dependent methyltransferase [Zavarzinia compransoris]PWR22289.1 methyltransferase [Zavarzinia compransoris]TDP46947.1 methyltransferase family protein [Zavarzinia compransoris]
MSTLDTDRLVARHYETLPYPARNPKDEAKRLIEGSPSALPEIRHWIFGGALPAGLRVLFAGGGTGDGCIMLAQQLKDAGIAATVTHLDMSAAAQKVAAERAAVRGLDIQFVAGSLLDVERLAPGPYDYIDCCGVLHHLDAPAAGLAALRSVLARGGGMGLMVYGRIGRSGVYDVQEALRLLSPEEDAPAARLNVAKRLLPGLPATNRLRRNEAVTDHAVGGDAGIFDLLLHSRDRAYDIEGFVGLIEDGGLGVTALIEPARYQPETYLADPQLRRLATALDPRGRAMLAERLAGNIARHVAYAVHPDHEAVPPDPLEEAAVPVWSRTGPEQMIAAMGQDRVLKLVLDGLSYRFPLPQSAPAILRHVDGRATVGEIAARAKVGGFEKAWPATFAVLNGISRLFLARP